MNGIALLISFSPNSLLMFRKTRSYYLTECISFKSFLMGSSGFVMYRTISSAFRINLVFSTPDFFLIYLLCVFTHMCATTHVPCGGQWTIFRRHFLSCYVGPGDQIWVTRFLFAQPSCVFRLFLLRSFYEFYARPWGAFYHCSFKFSICHAFLQFPCILSYLERPCNLVFLHLHLFIPYRSGDSWPRSFLVISFLLKICLGVLVYYILLILIEHCNILWSLCRLTMVSSLNIEQAKGAGARTLPFQPGWSRRHLT